MSIPPAVLPKELYSIDDVRSIISGYAKKHTFTNLLKYSPDFFNKIASLKYPLDIWITRNLVYKNGNGFIDKIESGLQAIENALGPCFVANLYKEIGNYDYAYQLFDKLKSTEAEINCAFIIKNIGAENIEKIEKISDLTCYYNNYKYCIQVKHKNVEDFNITMVEESMLGVIHDPISISVRKYNFSTIQLTQIRRGFPEKLFDYFHEELNGNVAIIESRNFFNGEKIYENEILKVIVEKYYSDDFNMRIYGKVDYSKSSISIDFEPQTDIYYGGSAEVSYSVEQFNAILYEYIKECVIKQDKGIIYWLQIDLKEKYESYVCSEKGKYEMEKWLNENIEVPIVLYLYIRFPENPNHIKYIVNNKARENDLVKKLINK